MTSDPQRPLSPEEPTSGLWPSAATLPVRGRLSSELSRLPRLPGSREMLTPTWERNGQCSPRVGDGVPGDPLLAQETAPVWLAGPRRTLQSPGWRQNLIGFYDSNPSSLLQGASVSYTCAKNIFLGLQFSLFPPSCESV